MQGPVSPDTALLMTEPKLPNGAVADPDHPGWYSWGDFPRGSFAGATGRLIFRPTGDEAPASLFRDSSMVDPGTVADVIAEPAQSFIVFVEKREVEKMPDANTRLDSEVTSAVSQNRMRAFISWLADRTESAKVERLYKKNS